MQKIMNAVFLGSLLTLASCSAKTDGGNNQLAEKKAKLGRTEKTAKNPIEDNIASLEAEIQKLDPSAKTEKTKLVSISPISFPTLRTISTCKATYRLRIFLISLRVTDRVVL
jgi:hypothetical protein